MTQYLARDWAPPRSACAFTGYSGNVRDGPGGPIGTLLLCVANTPIPCKVEGIEAQKSIQLTVINIRKQGWSYAPWWVPARRQRAPPRLTPRAAGRSRRARTARHRRTRIPRSSSRSRCGPRTT